MYIYVNEEEKTSVECIHMGIAKTNKNKSLSAIHSNEIKMVNSGISKDKRAFF